MASIFMTHRNVVDQIVWQDCYAIELV